MRWVSAALTVVMLVIVPAIGRAEPLLTVKEGAVTPGVVVAWSGEGKKIELTLKEDADTAAVAAAIESSLDRIRVKIKAGQLLVIGLAKDELLSALAGIDVGQDDLDILAAAAEADDEIDTGSSIRAKKVGVDNLLADRKVTAVGRVVAVKRGTFPATRVIVRILRGPTGQLRKAVRKGKRILFAPRLAKKGAGFDLSDPATVANLGTWFLKNDDRVRIKIGSPIEGGYEAELIVR